MISKKYPHIITAFENVVVLKKGVYPYPVSPFAGVVDPIDSRMFDEITEAVKSKKELLDSDLVISFESSGNQIAAILSQTLHIPCLLARKKQFNLPLENTFSVKTNYDTKNFYLYGDLSDRNIILVDDVVASGSTIKSAIDLIQKQNAIVGSIFVIATKNNRIGRRYQDTLSEYNIPIFSLINIEVVNGKVVVSSKD